jgi:hypothetical protein
MYSLVGMDHLKKKDNGGGGDKGGHDGRPFV